MPGKGQLRHAGFKDLNVKELTRAIRKFNLANIQNRIGIIEEIFFSSAVSGFSVHGIGYFRTEEQARRNGPLVGAKFEKRIELEGQGFALYPHGRSQRCRPDCYPKENIYFAGIERLDLTKISKNKCTITIVTRF